jgi:Transcription factor TFIIH complex subunit Tfb5
MGPKRKTEKKATSARGKGTASATAGNKGLSTTSASPKVSKQGNKDLPPPAGYLVSCDIPTKQFIHSLNDNKTTDKKFIIEDLDAEHLLVKESAREEIEREVERWMDENVFSAIERVGENLDMS